MKRVLTIFLLIFSFHVLSAIDIFINGVKVTGISDQEIKSCSVVIDKDGNILISAPDVKILKDSEKMKKEYFASVSFSAPLQSEFTLLVNGKTAIKIAKGETESLVELSSYLQKGENIISYTSLPVTNPVKIKIVAGTGEKKDNSIEFSPITEHAGEITNLGAAGNFKFVAE
ncbi:MAG TPA: hypothetical protein PKG52_00420 [bacterium]|nr:hypothetical protein [bacterium]HPS29002.1 hypothetical protein [bacterium]